MLQDLTPTQRKIAADMLRMAAEHYSNHGCNDFELEYTPEHVEFIKGMIAASDYPEDQPNIHGDQIYTMDWKVMQYLSNLLWPTTES